MKKQLKKLHKLFTTLFAFIFFHLYNTYSTIQVLATNTTGGGGIADSKIVTGTTKLINDASTILLVFLPSVGGVMIIFFCIRMAITSEEHEKIKYKKNMIATIVCVVVGLVATGIISIISGYYK